MSQEGVARAGGALFRGPGQDGLIHRAFLRGEGYSADDVRRSPVIGICTSWSELNPCNAGLRDLAAEVKAGVAAGGGLALEFPTISISEPFTRPTSLFLRNLMSMDVEESITSAPIDGVVLLGGCDKTVPAGIMGALSANKPAIVVTAGPRPVPCYDGEPFTIDDLWPAIERRRIGTMNDEEWLALEGRVNTGVGTCNVMGTAITMAAIAEVLGFALPGSALAPAASDARRAIARTSGEAIVDAVRRASRPTELVTMPSLENAFRVVCALGGSTNTVIHLEAIAGRAGLSIGTRRFEAWAASTPYLTNVRPNGTMLLADLEHAGGVPEVMRRIAPLLSLDTPTAAGETWRARLSRRDTLHRTHHAGSDPDALDADSSYPDRPDSAASHPGVCENDSSREASGSGVIATMAVPLASRGGITMLHGNLAPRGAVLKTAGVSDPRLQQHRGKVIVFDGVGDLNTRIDDPALGATADSILVLRGMGVIGAPGMPEVGHIPIPGALARAGVHDMLRISDARMSGTSTGTVVLHVTPEAAVGGPLAYLATGDDVELDVAAGTLTHFLSDEEMACRTPYRAADPPSRGYAWLHRQHALQPDQGCDFDFLRGDFRRDPSYATENE